MIQFLRYNFEISFKFLVYYLCTINSQALFSERLEDLFSFIMWFILFYFVSSFILSLFFGPQKCSNHTYFHIFVANNGTFFSNYHLENYRYILLLIYNHLPSYFSFHIIINHILTLYSYKNKFLCFYFTFRYHEPQWNQTYCDFIDVFLISRTPVCQLIIHFVL